MDPCRAADRPTAPTITGRSSENSCVGSLFLGALTYSSFIRGETQSMRLAIASLFLMSTFAFPANAADWARSMFGSTSHDFGTVARAAKTEYQFQFENRSNQTIHVRSVRTSCGCTTPMIVTETVEPGQTGTILARFNTHTHTGQRQATVTVTFDRPQFTEVQLLVKGYIRSDIVFNPGKVTSERSKKVPRSRSRSTWTTPVEAIGRSSKLARATISFPRPRKRSAAEMAE